MLEILNLVSVLEIFKSGVYAGNIKSGVCARNIHIWCLCWKYSHLVSVLEIFKSGVCGRNIQIWCEC